MAKYKVKDYQSSIKPNSAGAENIYIECVFVNSGGNDKRVTYRVWNDERHPDLLALKNLLDKGFTGAKLNRSKIELTEYLQRLYLHLTFPDIDEGKYLQVSAEKV
tara:strand:+ start:3589 stop:3903 length:315 start_codon:yes stop_codon:yes gene_type:complete